MVDQLRVAVIMEMTVSAKSDGSHLHREQIAVIFPRTRELYMGGSSFTRSDDHVGIGYYLRRAALNSRIFPNSLNQNSRRDDLYRLKMKMKQTGFNLDVKHIETLEFESPSKCQAALKNREPSTIGPLFEGRYN